MIKHNYFKTNATFDQTTTGSNDISIIEDTGKLVTHNKEYQFVTDDFKKELDDNELVIASALNDLNLRLENLENFEQNLADWVKNPNLPTPEDIGAEEQLPYMTIDLSKAGPAYVNSTVQGLDSFDEIDSTQSNKIYILNDEWKNAQTFRGNRSVCNIMTSEGIAWITSFNQLIFINCMAECLCVAHIFENWVEDGQGNITSRYYSGRCDTFKLDNSRDIIETKNYSSSSSSVTLYPGKYYLINGNITNSFEFKISSATSILVKTFEFEFTTATSNITLPSTVKWQTPPNIQANKRYYVKIRNNIGTIIETDI